MTGSITRWRLGRFPSCYVRPIANRVSLRLGTDGATPLPATTKEIVDEADDDAEHFPETRILTIMVVDSGSHAPQEDIDPPSRGG